MRNFRNLEIWKDGIEIVKKIYSLSTELPPEERYGLKSQIQRAAVSCPSNIAEGTSRSSQLEFKRFLKIALGSLFELETQLVIIQEVNLCNSDLTELFKSLHILQRKINALMSKIKESMK